MLTIQHLHNWRAELPSEIQQQISHRLSFKKFRKDEFIYNSGETSNCGFQVVSGKVKICNYNKEGRELIVAILHAGDCFGDIGLITRYNRPNYAVACTDVEVNVLSHKDYLHLSQHFPEMSIALNRFLCTRIQYTFASLNEALLLPLYERLGAAIVRLALSRGAKELEAVSLPDISQEMLGQMVGATRQSVGRELKKMQQENLIQIEYGKIFINDIDNMIKLFDLNLSHQAIVPLYSTMADTV
ncbi:hypothetical protein BCU94_14510 [Shewanella sp. 10N.286.52.C2]|uniref:Crp/Fnr family transcriptional regulator n=1 Tax=Shewanella sp. 10N.286.52.C2 TaxID=1880838 RepID=UPI000C84A0A0|nr:Crp/Fnr family transcriptional regulator [Shewanella sp. 10N.286.52.C2]PMG29302.1 hypothetical protein BCU94_14510 [Shewanella sp. 10N.286.52.C2]